MTTAHAPSTDRTQDEITEREKFYADLNRTRAETEKTYAEMRKLNLESSRSLDETMKMRAEKDRAEADAKKLIVDTMKVQLEVRWFPYAVIGSMVFAWLGVGAAFVHALIKLFSL